MNVSARECGSIAQSETYTASYCLYPASKDRVVVYFNGVNSTELQWETDVGKYVYATLPRLGRSAPSAISISIGRVHFLSSRRRQGGKTDIREAHETIFALINRLKARNLLNANARVMLTGMSMGGFNALQVFLRFPNSFSGLAVLCPAGTRVSPFASDEEWERNRVDEGGDFFSSLAFRQAMQVSFSTQTSWLKNSPLEYGRHTYRNAARQPIFISRTTRDHYGFNKVQLNLAAIFRDAGHTVTSATTVGEHCAFGAEALSRALTD